MSTITLRNTKGSALTHTEVDNNFTNLNNDKLENITSQSIENLSDVASMTPSDGQVLKWNNSNSNWEAGDGGASTGKAIAMAIVFGG